MIISADMAIAIPIAMLSMLLLTYSISSSQSYYLAYASSSYAQIRYYSISQQMLEVLNGENSSAYPESIQNLSRFYNVSASIINLVNYPQCSGSFCRIVELGAATRIMVIK